MFTISDIANEPQEIIEQLRASKFKPSVSDHIFGRSFYFFNTVAEIIQLVCTVAFAIFASVLAGICFGQLTKLNDLTVQSWNESGFTAHSAYLSLRGIVDFEQAPAEKFKLYEKRVEDFMSTPLGQSTNQRILSLLPFDVNALQPTTGAEHFFLRIFNVVNLLKEIVFTILAYMRQAIAYTAWLGSFTSATSIAVFRLEALHQSEARMISGTLSARSFLGYTAV